MTIVRFSILLVCFFFLVPSCRAGVLDKIIGFGKNLKKKIVGDTATPEINEICYDEWNIGCFEIGLPPFDRNGDILPQSPAEQGLKFHYYSREHFHEGKLLEANPYSIRESGLDIAKKTKIIVNGVYGEESDKWLEKARKKLLFVGDYNIIIVGWTKGALPSALPSALPGAMLSVYPPASNYRVVAAMLAQLIKTAKVDKDTIHCIGFNIGAHICGDFGTRLNKIERITGLSPIKKAFDGDDPHIRLDATDAKFVDVIHTDDERPLLEGEELAGGYGMKAPMGHVDFYVNQGKSQPGCTNNDYSSTLEVAPMACSSMKSAEMFIDTIFSRGRSCQFISIPCANNKAYERGSCSDCGKHGCAKMGLHATDTMPLNSQAGKHLRYYVHTTKQKPYCVHPYHVLVKIDTPLSGRVGTLAIVIYGTNGPTEQLEMALSDDHYNSEKEAYTAVVYADHDVGTPTAIRIHFHAGSQKTFEPVGFAVTGNFVRQNTTRSYFKMSGGPLSERDEYGEDDIRQLFAAKTVEIIVA